MNATELKAYLADHRDEHPNLGDRSFNEIWNALPDQDSRYESEEGMVEMLNEIDYR